MRLLLLRKESNEKLSLINQYYSHQLTASTSSYEQRDFVIRELIDTESNYLDVLLALKHKFMVPMEKLLTRDELRRIYPKIKVIIHSMISF